MTSAAPSIYIVCPPGPELERILGAVEAPMERVFDTVPGFLDATGARLDASPTSPPDVDVTSLFRAGAPVIPGPREPEPVRVVVLGRGVPADHTLRLIRDLGERTGIWIPMTIEEDANGDGAVGRPVSIGYPVDLNGLSEAEETPKPILEIRSVLKHISRARHDINNPLTSGLAETALLLMDVEDAELRESLEVIQEQLRRIRDLVSALSVLRQPYP